MKKTIILFLLAIIATLTATAQVDSYKSLEVNGKDAKYQEYWSVQKTDSENKYVLEGKRYVVTAKIQKLPSGTPVGFSLIKVEDGKRWRGVDLINNYHRVVGNPRIVARHKYDKDGYVVIGDYIFELSEISQDGTSFGSISAIFIKIGGEAEEKKVEEEPKKKKKMSFKEKLKAAKAKLTDVATVSYGPEHKKACNTNLNKLVSDYLKKMNANPPNAKQKAEIAEIQFARKNKDADIKAYNDSIKATPEYKKMKAHQKWMKGNINVEVKNNSSHTYWVGSSKEAFIISEISAGQSRTMNCTTNLYYYSSNTKGSKGTLFHSAKSGCGGSVTLN